MNTLRLDFINKRAPYLVKENPHAVNSYVFKTDTGTEFVISLQENSAIVPSGAYELGINNPHHGRSPLDTKLKYTIFAIVEEFFEQNNDVMLYITETGDKKQAFRDRLFVRWFNTYEHKDRYFIQTAEGMMEEQMNFMAIISRKDNPHLYEKVEEFNEIVSILFSNSQ